MSEVVGIYRLLEQTSTSQCRATKMQDMELVKVMLAEINANMKSNRNMIKSNQEKAEANKKGDQEHLVARLETDRQERKAERKAYQQDPKNMMERILRDKQDAWLG
jgi:hypothetical protein